jgi:sensor histidine kinase YesM
LFQIKKNIHWFVLFLTLIVLGVHLYILHMVYQFDWILAAEDGICSSIVVGMSVWGIFLLIRSYPTTAAIVPYALLMALLISTAGVFAELQMMRIIIGDKNLDYKLWLVNSLSVRFLINWIFNSWMATNAALRKNLSALDTRFQQQSDASALLKEAELFKLRQQLQPHFLYNSLNSISALIMIAPDKAQDMIGKLSDFLRSSVRRESEDTLPVEEELNYIRSYLAIESVRFGDRLQVHFEKEYTDDATIPPFLMQPILENAIKFGLYGKTGTVDIVFHIVLDGPMLTITITNPFDPNMQPPRGTGFGLEGVNRRLYLLFARTDLLETHKDNQNFTTILKIPQSHVQSSNN